MTIDVVGSLAGLVDSFFQRVLVQRHFLPRRIDGHLERLNRATSMLSTLDDSVLFPAPPRIEPRPLAHGRYRGMPTQSFCWDLPTLPAAEVFGLAANTSGPCATLFARGGRPIWVLVHGWLGGSRFMDEVFWPLRVLFRTHDIALLVLPGHGARRHPKVGGLPSFPSRNPIRNVLGLLSAVTETRQLIDWLRTQNYTQIGVAGTSLGVQVAALLATVSPVADRFLFDRPLSQLSDPLRRCYQTESCELSQLLDALEACYRPVSPLQRPSRVTHERVDVLLGRQDRVVGHLEGAALARHFGAEAQTFPTGHVLSVGREAVIVELMRKLGETTEPQPRVFQGE